MRYPNHWLSDPRFPVEDWKSEVINDETRLGYAQWVELMRDLADPEPGPTYDVWISEPDDWNWTHTGRFTCEDDPDGIGARRSAHLHARNLRTHFPCAYLAVRPAGKAPLPIHTGDEP